MDAADAAIHADRRCSKTFDPPAPMPKDDPVSELVTVADDLESEAENVSAEDALHFARRIRKALTAL
jgi:hypothetical protein